MKKIFIIVFSLFAINFVTSGLVEDNQCRKLLYLHNGSKIEVNTIWENLGNIYYSAGWNIGSYPLDLVDLEKTFGKARAEEIIGQMQRAATHSVKKIDPAERLELAETGQNTSLKLVEGAKQNLLHKIEKLRQMKSTTDAGLNDYYDTKIKIIENKIDLLIKDPEFAFYAEHINYE